MRGFTSFVLTPPAVTMASSMGRVPLTLTATYPGRFYLPAVSCSAMYDASVSAAERYGLGYNLVAGANIAGFEKVAEAMMAQGWI